MEKLFFIEYMMNKYRVPWIDKYLDTTIKPIQKFEKYYTLSQNTIQLIATSR